LTLIYGATSLFVGELVIELIESKGGALVYRFVFQPSVARDFERKSRADWRGRGMAREFYSEIRGHNAAKILVGLVGRPGLDSGTLGLKEGVRPAARAP